MPAIRTILHPTDMSVQAAAAADYACFLAQQFDAQLHLLYVVEDAMGKIPEPELGFPPPGDHVPALSAMLPRLQEALGIDLPEADRLLLATRLGPIDAQIIAYADEQSIDLIVIGTHGRRGIAHALLGSVAEAVVRKASCPVLTVRCGQPATE